MAGIDSYAKLVLHMDGSDASTTFTDSSLSPYTMTTVGNAQIDTAQSKFGGASGLFDGSGDRVTAIESDDFDFGSGEWCIDMWVRVNTLPTSGNRKMLFAKWAAAGNNRCYYAGIENSSGSYKLFFIYTTDGATVVDRTGTTTSMSTGTWYHLAWERDSNTLRYYIDGTGYGTTDLTGVTIYNGSRIFEVGSGSDFSAGFHYDGWIDEFRVTKGTARYRGNFTPETSAYSVASTGGFMTTNKGWL